MTGSALLTLVATILAVDAGMVEIDAGSNRGLQAGQEGAIYYEFPADGSLETVEVGPAKIVEVAFGSAKLRIRPDLHVSPGYLIRFTVPTDTPTPPRRAVITDTAGSCLRLRERPSLGATSLGCVPEGAAVVVIESESDWHRARLSDGNDGWLAAGFLAFDEPQVAGAMVAPEFTRSEAAVVPLIDQLAASFEEADSEVTDLLGKVIANHNALNEAERSRAGIARRLLEAAVSDLESRLAAVEAERDETERARAELAATVETLVAEGLRLEQELGASLSRELAARSELDRLGAELTASQTGLSERDLELAQNSDKLTAAVDLLEQANAERGRLRAELIQARSETSQAQAVGQAAQNALRREIERVETDLAATQGRLEEARSQLTTRQARIDALERERSARPTRELEDAEARIAGLQAEIDRLETSNPEAGYQQEASRTRMALSDERRRSAELEARYATQQQRTRELEAELGAARSQLADLSPAGVASRTPFEDLTRDTVEPASSLVVLTSANPCLNLRVEPALKSKTFDCLQPGTQLGRLGHWEGWRYVELVDGRSGWVSALHVAPAGIGGS